MLVSLTSGLKAAVIATMPPQPSTRSRPSPRFTVRWIPVAILLGLTSCTSGTDDQFNIEHQESTPDTTSPSPSSPPSPMVLLNREPIQIEDLADFLAEAAGAEVLSAVILDRLVRAECQRRTKDIVPTDLLMEELILLESLNSDPTTAARLLVELRDRRGLGERRYDLLLHTNARLRALVWDEITVDPLQVRIEFSRQFGPRYDIRILTHPDRAIMEKALARARQGESFIDLAVEFSTDLSADRGGLVGPISPVDPAYPQAVRQLLADLSPGETSPILELDSGLCLVQVVRMRPGLDVTFEAVEAEVETSLRWAMERQRMEALARELMREAEVIVLDPALNDAWRARKGR